MNQRDEDRLINLAIMSCGSIAACIVIAAVAVVFAIVTGGCK